MFSISDSFDPEKPYFNIQTGFQLVFIILI